MSRLIELVGGGLVTSTEASLLQPGMLTQCDNWVYEPASDGLITAAGLTEFSATVPGTVIAVDGLKAARFRSGTHVLVAAADNLTNSIWTSPVADTGTWTARVTTATQGTGPLELVYYNDKYFLLTGVTANRELQSDLTTRRHGLAAVTVPPGIEVVSGTWSVPTDSGTVYYEYWTTEVVRYSDGTELESTVSPPAASAANPNPGPPTVTATINAATQAVKITRHNPLANSEATHWRVYRSTKKATAAETAWPTGFRISPDIPITTSTTTIDVAGCTYVSTAVTTTNSFDGVRVGWAPSVVAGNWVLGAGTLVASISSRTGLVLTAAPLSGTGSATLRFTPTNAADANIFFDQVNSLASNITGAAPVISSSGAWVNATNIFANDGSNATVTVSFGNPAELVLGNFNFGTLQDPIAGLAITLEWRTPSSVSSALSSSASTYTTAQISTDGGTTYGIERAFPAVVSSTTTSTVVLGSSTDGSDKWGVLLGAGGLTGASFRIKLKVYNALSYDLSTTASAAFDFIAVAVSSNVAVGATSDPFPAVFVTVGDTSGLPQGTTGVGANGQPPRADTGGVFEDSLVLNDKTQLSYLRWSLAGEPHYFPSIYFIDFRQNVKCFRVLNNKGIVGLDSGLWRVNYLPNTDDAQFSRGRALDQISSQYGISNNQCAVVYQGPEGRPELAFANLHGVYATDGYVIRPLVSDLDWYNVNSTTYRPQPISLYNNPETWELVLVYKVNTASGQYETYELHLNYHPKHLRDGMLKVSGPVKRFFTTGSSTNYGTTCAVAVSRYDASDTRTISVYSGMSVASGAGGQVYRDVYSTLNGVGGTAIVPTMTTRRMYLAGYGEEWKANEFYLASTNAGQAGTLTVTPLVTTTGNVEAAQTARTTGGTYSGSRLDKIVFNQNVEGMRWRVSVNVPWQLDYLIVDGEDFGSEESGA